MSNIRTFNLSLSKMVRMRVNWIKQSTSPVCAQDFAKSNRLMTLHSTTRYWLCVVTCWLITSNLCCLRCVHSHSVARDDGSIRNGHATLWVRNEEKAGHFSWRCFRIVLLIKHTTHLENDVHCMCVCIWFSPVTVLSYLPPSYIRHRSLSLAVFLTPSHIHTNDYSLFIQWKLKPVFLKSLSG